MNESNIIVAGTIIATDRQTAMHILSRFADTTTNNEIDYELSRRYPITINIGRVRALKSIRRARSHNAD